MTDPSFAIHPLCPAVPPHLPSNAHIVLASSSLPPVTRSSLLITIPARHNQLPAATDGDNHDAANITVNNHVSTSSQSRIPMYRHPRPRRSNTLQNNNDNNDYAPSTALPLNKRHNIDLNAIANAAHRRHQSRRPATRGTAAVNDENKITATRSTKNAGLALRGKVSFHATADCPF